MCGGLFCYGASRSVVDRLSALSVVPAGDQLNYEGSLMPDIEDRTVGIPWYVLEDQASANPRNEDTFWQVLRICEI